MDDAATLGASGLFQAFGPHELADVAALTTRRRVSRGEVVFIEGDPAERMYLVRSGRVALARGSSGARVSGLSLRGAGDLFGELSLFDGAPRASKAQSLEPGELLVIPYPPVAAVFEQRPALLEPAVRLLVNRLRAAESALAGARSLDVAGRTARQLIELAGDQDELRLPITQEELAGMVGASRERVNKALAQFVRLGWLTADGRRYRILQRRELERRAR